MKAKILIAAALLLCSLSLYAQTREHKAYHSNGNLAEIGNLKED